MTIIDRSAIDVVRVDLGARSYDIKIGGGLVARAGEMIAPALKQKRAAIVTDAHVAKLYLDEVQQSLRGAGIASEAIVLPAGPTMGPMLCRPRLLGDGGEPADATGRAGSDCSRSAGRW